MRVFSTFSGIGGFEKGITAAIGEKAEFIAYSEIDKYASSVYEKQFKGVPNYGDITKIQAEELPDFDCLVGGFPCQAFSIAGKRAGFNDTRGTLFFDLARILRAKQPRLFVFENVKGLLSHDGGRTFKTIIETIDELGYDVQWQVLNSKNYGVPQNRERVYIVGHLRGTPRPEVFPIGGNSNETSNQVTDKGQLVDLTRREPTAYRERKDGRAGTLDANYYKGLANQERPGVVQLNQPTHSNDRVYGADGISPTLNTMQGGNRQPFVKVPEATKKGYAEATVGDAINLTAINSKTRRGRVSNIAPTVDTGMQLHTLTEDVRIRRLTPIECERLQGFPETEVDAIIEVCIDHQKNSVNVELKSLKSQKLAGTVARTESVNDASSAKITSPLNDQLISKPAQPNVHIRLEGERVELRNQQRSLLYVSGATSQSSSALPMPDDVFAQTIAGILRTAEKIITTGKAASAQKEQSSMAQGNGKSLEKTFGYEITLPVNDVLSDLTILKESLKYTTSDHLDSEKLGSNLATLSYYVASATSGFTDDSTKTKSISTIHLSERYGWTQYSTNGAVSDTQRYKMCGNAVTTNVVQAVFERIFNNYEEL